MRHDATGIDGALIVDKPPRVTSHDVVAAVRRLTGITRVGHTGTLDPLATGVLPLLMGRATRLARFLAGDRKRYEAHVRFGWATDTGDAGGRPIGEPTSVTVHAAALERTLERFRGELLQQPPAFSAKHVHGRRAYRLARQNQAPELEPVPVTVFHLEVLRLDADTAVLDVECSAGFYVRSLAQDLGAAMGSAAHLAGLRRTVSGPFGLADAVSLDRLASAADARTLVVPMERLAGHLPAVALTHDVAGRVGHGLPVRTPGDVPPGTHVRMLGPDGRLIAIGARGDEPGLLRPTVVLV